MHNHLMSFHWDTKVGVFLFPGLNVNGLSGLLVLSLVLILLCVIYEAVKVFQTQTRARAARERLRASSYAASETATLLSAERQQHQHRDSFSKKFLVMLGQAVIFLMHNALGYFLMLAVMVYNVYVFVAVILGLGLGYFLFGHISMKINMENIRARTTNAMFTPKSPVEPSSSGVEQECSTKRVRADASSSSSTSSNCHTNYSSVSQLQDEVEIYPTSMERVDSNVQSCRL